MNSTKFTPGPWHVYDRGIGFEVHKPGNNRVLCNGTPCGDVVNSGWRETFSKADAHLIAAAPDMFDALKFVKRFFQELEAGTEEGDPLKEMRRKYHAPVHTKLDAALAKAEGRS